MGTPGVWGRVSGSAEQEHRRVGSGGLRGGPHVPALPLPHNGTWGVPEGTAMTCQPAQAVTVLCGQPLWPWPLPRPHPLKVLVAPTREEGVGVSPGGCWSPRHHRGCARWTAWLWLTVVWGLLGDFRGPLPLSGEGSSSRVVLKSKVSNTSCGVPWPLGSFWGQS